MDRIHHPTAVPTPPPVDPHPTGGFPTAGNPVGGVPATVLTPWIVHQLIEELRGPVARAGLAPSKASTTQLREALDRLYAGRLTTLSASAVLGADNAGLVLVDAAAGAITLTLPSAAAAGGRPILFRLVRIDASANAVTVQRAGADLIDGTPSLPIAPLGRATLISDGFQGWRRTDAQAPHGGIAVFTASGNFTVPPGVSRVTVEVWGGGGGGGGANQPGAAAGGGAGGYAAGAFAVSPGAAIPVTVGAGGTGGTSAPTNGTAGGSSSFGALVSATGGGGGQLNLGGISTVPGAAGAGAGGQFVVNGVAGAGQGLPLGGTNFVGGQGGAAFGGAAPPLNFNAAGTPATGIGNGGNGAAAAAAGGNGAPGMVVVRW